MRDNVSFGRKLSEMSSTPSLAEMQCYPTDQECASVVKKVIIAVSPLFVAVGICFCFPLDLFSRLLVVGSAVLSSINLFSTLLTYGDVKESPTSPLSPNPSEESLGFPV